MSILKSFYSQSYSDTNHWTEDETKSILFHEELSINGHMPFGATSYPNARDKQIFFIDLPLVYVIAII